MSFPSTATRLKNQAESENALHGLEVDHHAHHGKEDGNEKLVYAVHLLLNLVRDVGLRQRKPYYVGADYHRKAGKLGES